MPVPKESFGCFLINLHMDAKSYRVIVNHDLLLTEPQAESCSTYNVFNIVIDGLFYVNIW